MSVSKLVSLTLFSTLMSSVAFGAAAPARGAAAPAAPPPAAAQPTAPEPAAPPGGAVAPGTAPANQFSINQPVGDWAVRCALTTVRSPAPCDMIQITVNQDTKQRVMSISFAYVPSRDAFAMQAVVPTGVALTRGMTLAAGNVALQGVRYNRCERDGCYIETLVDAPTVNALTSVGESTSVTVTGYGQFNEFKLPVSLKGFPEALDRMRGLARDRATPLPAGTPTPPPISATPYTPPPAAAAGTAPAAAPAAAPPAATTP
ncbi:MAG: hypothetical protein EXR00_08650 [Alphaproteobacteria bacterium]|nr:hypothetical protein [Alphaproteobacteria bacterium]